MLIGSTFQEFSATTPASVTCRAWMDRRDSWAPGETYVAVDGICFDGTIDRKSADQFVTKLGSRIKSEKRIIIVRSPGGDTEAAMIMARAILKQSAEVRIQGLCISRCADYLLAAGKIRVVSPGSLLGFHGGVRALQPDTIQKEVAEEQGRIISAAEAEFMSKELKSQYAEQENLALKSHVKRGFYQWMNRFSNLPSVRQRKACYRFNDDTDFFVLSPDLLRSKGYRLTSYAGPNSERELQKTLKQFGWPIGFACFMSKRNGRF